MPILTPQRVPSSLAFFEKPKRQRKLPINFVWNLSHWQILATLSFLSHVEAIKITDPPIVKKGSEIWVSVRIGSSMDSPLKLQHLGRIYLNYAVLRNRESWRLRKHCHL